MNMKRPRQGARGTPRAHQADGRRREGPQAARARQVDRARANGPLLRRRQMVRGRHSRHADGALRRGQAAGRRGACAATATSTGAWCCAAAYDFTVKGGVDRADRRDQGVAAARIGAAQSHSDGLVHRLGGRANRSASRGRTGDLLSLFAGAGALFREEVIMSGVIPLVAAMVGPGAAGTAYIPGLADFVPMLKDIGSMALGGAAAGQGGDRAGHRRAGARRHQGARREVGRRRRRGRGRLRVRRASSRNICRSSRRIARRSRRSSCARDPIDRRDERLLEILPESTRQSYDMYEIIKQRRRLRAAARDQAEVRQAPSSPGWRASAGGRAASWPTIRAIWAGFSPTIRPTRRRTSFRYATRSTSRSCS